MAILSCQVSLIILFPNFNSLKMQPPAFLQKHRNLTPYTPILRDLHWLLVRERIHFKLLLLIKKALNGLAPSLYQIFFFHISHQFMLYVLVTNIYSTFLGLLHLKIVHFQSLLLLFGIHYLKISEQNVVTLFNHLRLC